MSYFSLYVLSCLFPGEALSGLTGVGSRLGLSGPVKARELPVPGPQVGQLGGEDLQLGGGLVHVIFH